MAKSLSPELLIDELCTSIANHTISNNTFDTINKRLSAHKPATLLEAFQSWEPTQDPELKTDKSRYAIQQIIAAIAILARKKDTPLPNWFIPHLKTLPPANSFIPRDTIISLVKETGDKGIVEAIEQVIANHFFARQLTPLLALEIQDEAAFAHAINLIADDLLPKNFAPLVEGHVDRVIPIIAKKRADGDDSDGLQTLHVMLANQRCSQDDDDLYLELLGHRLKGMRQRAQFGVDARGEKGRAVLERGSSARKKAVREWCKTQLAILGEPTDTPEQSPNSFESLDDTAKEKVCDRIDDLYQKSKKVWNTWLKNEVASDPMLWFHATLALFEKNTSFVHRWAVFKTLLTDKNTSTHHEEMWRIYLHHLARNPSLSDSYEQWHIKKHFNLIPESYEQEVLEHALLGANGPMTTSMFEHYFAVQLCSPSMLPIAITHKSKKVRDAAIKASPYWPKTEDASAVAALLEARKKATRQYAAEALFRMPIESAAPHLEALKNRLENEKDSTVQGTIDAAISRIEKHTA